MAHEVDDRPREAGPTGTPFAGSMLSPSEIGAVNRALVVQALWDHGPCSRADLARMGGVTRATIGNIVNDLIDAGVIEESDPRLTGRVGKPARPVWFAPGSSPAASVVLGAGTCTAAVVDARGERLATVHTQFDRTAAFEVVVDAITEALEALLGRIDGVVGIGITVPGVCDPVTGDVVGSGQLPGLGGANLARPVADRTGLPVVVDNDARALALGEKWFGDGRAVGTFAALQTGEGLGCGLVIDGAILRGDSGQVGEIGHTCVDRNGVRCRCGLRGCWETIGTLGWLRAEASRRSLPDAAWIDTGQLVGRAAAEPAAGELLIDFVDNLSVGLANLVQLIRPERIVLHGDVTNGGDTVLGLLHEAVDRRSHVRVDYPTEIVFSSLGPDAGLVGGAGLVWADTFRLQI